MIPRDKNMLNISGACLTTCIPLKKNNQNKTNKIRIPINTNSSPTIGKIKKNHKKMLNEKIDLTHFMLDLITSYKV